MSFFSDTDATGAAAGRDTAHHQDLHVHDFSLDDLDRMDGLDDTGGLTSFGGDKDAEDDDEDESLCEFLKEVAFFQDTGYSADLDASIPVIPRASIHSHSAAATESNPRNHRYPSLPKNNGNGGVASMPSALASGFDSERSSSASRTAASEGHKMMNDATAAAVSSISSRMISGNASVDADDAIAVVFDPTPFFRRDDEGQPNAKCVIDNIDAAGSSLFQSHGRVSSSQISISISEADYMTDMDQTTKPEGGHEELGHNIVNHPDFVETGEGDGDANATRPRRVSWNKRSSSIQPPPDDTASANDVDTPREPPATRKRRPQKSSSTKSQNSTSAPRRRLSMARAKQEARRPSRRRREDVEVSQRIYVEMDNLDVLMGRGGRSNHHEGNNIYRRRVLELQPRYKTLSHKEKTKCSADVVKWVKEGGGRFLRQDKTREDGSQWYIVPDSIARNKVAQALREDHSEHGKSMKRLKGARLKEIEAPKFKESPNASSDAV